MGSPRIHRIPLANPAVEYDQRIIGAQKITVQLEGNNPLRISYTRGGTANDYITIKAGYVYWDDEIDYYPALTIYLRAPTAGNQVAEILVWP